MSPEDTLKKYETALNSHNPANLDGLVDPNAVFIFTDGTFKGIDAIKAACVKTWAHFENEVYRVKNVDWIEESDQFALCTYIIDWSADLGGQRKFFKGRGTTVLKKTVRGWNIIHEHLSRMPEE